MDLGLTGRRAFVTGGSRGIGLAIARALASEGAVVSLCARTRRDVDAASRALAQLGQAGTCAVADVTDPLALENAVRKSGDAQGGLDLLVANAGGSRGGSLVGSSPGDWQHTMALNVQHAAHLVRAALPYLEVSPAPSVLFITSISGWKARVKSSYSVAKAAEIHLASVLAHELGPQGVRVNALSPGGVMFPGGRWARTRAEDPEAHDTFAAEPAGDQRVQR